MISWWEGLLTAAISTGLVASIIAWARYHKKDKAEVSTIAADATAINANTMLVLAENLKSMVAEERAANRHERERSSKLQTEADEQRRLNIQARHELEKCLLRCNSLGCKKEQGED